MHSPVKKLVGSAAALALCVSPTIAAAATPADVQPVNPLVAVSVFGTQASAQAVSSQVASTVATAEAAVAAQGQFDQDADSSTGMTTTGWVMIAVDLLVAGLGIYTLFDDDDENDDEDSVSPA
jgi:hypothetical protein